MGSVCHPSNDVRYNSAVMSQTFQKNEEDFVCEHCGADVKGNGYTNHCPKCLWSKHVDVKPGDRAATCGGMMKPIKTEGTVAEYVIVQKCEICKYEKKNKLSLDDNFDEVVKIAKARKV